MYKTVTSHDCEDFDRLLNNAEKDSFAVVSFLSHVEYVYNEHAQECKITVFVALLHKPDEPIIDRIKAMREAQRARLMPMEHLAERAEEVLKEEARRYGVGE